MRRTTMPWLIAAALGCLAAAPAQRLGLDRLAGVYKDRFPDALVSGERYTGEDILEVVKLSPTTAYIRIHIDGSNGHTCSLWGVADLVENALVYRAQKALMPGDPPCVLTIRPGAGKVALDDPNGSCHAGYCGERAGLNGDTFPLSARRPIGYLARLLSSSEYKAALAERAGEPTP